MKTTIKRYLFPLIFILTILIWLTAILSRAFFTDGYQILYSPGKYLDCANGWYDDSGNIVNIEKVVFTPDDLGKEMVFHYKIPEDVSFDGDASLCFFSRGMDFRLFSTAISGSGSHIFSYRQNAAKMSGSDIGLTVHVVPLRFEDRNNEISLAVTPTEYSAFVLQMRIEKASDFITGTVLERMPDFMGSVFIAFFGFSVIVYTWFTMDQAPKRRTALYSWGLFLVAVGILLIIQSQMIQILTGRPEFWSTLKYALVLVMTYLIALQIDSITQAPHKHYSHIMGYIAAALMVIETLGTIFNVLSFYRLWYISAILNTINMIIAIRLLIREWKYSRMHPETKLSVFLLAVIPASLIILGADLAIYALAQRHMIAWGGLLRIFVLAFLIAMLIIILRMSIRRNEQIYLVEKYRSESKAKSSFLANMSHEIRTPINAVLGMNEMILRESSEEDIISYASSVKTAGNTLLGIVNDILDFSKIEAGKMEIVPVDYDISSLINDLVNMVQSRADAKGLKLILEMDENIPKYLRGDEIRIKQVITNILSNAVKYTKTGTVTFGITVNKVEKDADSVVLDVYVKDTGIGIRKEDMKRLFTEFDRIEEDRNRNIEGTGLGMSITRRLLYMMDSSLKVQSVYGKGSVFSFSLNQAVVKWDPLGNYEESYRRSLADRKKYKEKFTAPNAVALIVDDYETNRIVFRSLIKQTMIQIDSAADGDLGLALMRKRKYDIIFLDHLMPGKDGIEVLMELRHDKKNLNNNTPVICLTANAISGAREQYINAGFDDYLTKPIDPDNLEKMLMEYLPDELINVTQEEVPEERSEAPAKAPKRTDVSDKLLPLMDQNLIDIEKGIKNSGSEDTYMQTLKVYDDTLDGRISELTAAIEEEDFNTYTIKVHALKSGLRIIGAEELGEEAQKLENAGKALDLDYIRQNHEDFMGRCKILRNSISEVFGGNESGIRKPVADDEFMNAVLDELIDGASKEDIRKLESIFSDMEEYTIPDNWSALWEDLRAAVKDRDLEKIVTLINRSKSPCQHM